jgi:hypothetical protein
MGGHLQARRPLTDTSLRPKHHAGRHTDDGRPGNDVELNRVFAGCHMTAMGSVPPPIAGGDWSNQFNANVNAGRAIDAIMGECMRAKGWLPGEAPAAQAAVAAAFHQRPHRKPDQGQVLVGKRLRRIVPEPRNRDVLEERA